MKVFIDEVYLCGLIVVIYVYGINGIKVVIKVGVDLVEYVSLFDDEVIDLVKKKGIYFFMDIYVIEYILGEGEKVGILEESLNKECIVGKI